MSPWSAPACAFVAVCVLLVSGCAPQTPDHPDWRSQGDQALADVGSYVATDRLLLQQLRAGKVFGDFAQTGVLDAETDAGTATTRFTALQPLSADDDEYRRVSTVLSDAGDLLAKVRIAVVRRDDRSYPNLIHQLSSTVKDLNSARTRLGGGPPR